MRLKKMHWIGIVFGFLITVVGILFFFSEEQQNLSFFLIGIGIAVAAFPFIVELMIENKREQRVNEMFLEFTRNLAESVSTGTPISKSIINMSRKNYGALTPNVIKLANQISLGIPVNRALQTFAHDINNPVISRAVELIGEAERAGGEIDYILDSVSRSIAEVEKLKKERRAAISSLVVQGYIIFFIFIGIMLVMEYRILPLATQVGQFGALTDASAFNPSTGDTPNEQAAFDSDRISGFFLYLLLFQGFFTGLTVGKLSEGSIKAGLKHSFILMISAFLISTGVRIILGPPTLA